eukprot:TRINITY_DN11507_c0_g1_i1.p1 TRINITY_DN11507_c0_g1~~TRINITY_DN11507_c0_g1_i1.p1  ORF type:complete len:475 (+),score=46.36 TRINITY_DN11507_c0_g1_i1:69-1493(+)
MSNHDDSGAFLERSAETLGQPEAPILGGRAIQRSRWSNFVPSMGNFSISYNFTSATIADSFLTDDRYLGYPLAEQPKWSEVFTLAAVFVGAIIGMSCMGRLGDLIGRLRAMRVTLGLTMLGSLIPAAAIGPPNLFYAIICLGRVILGIGVGGIYPLSAVSSVESSQQGEARGNRVGRAFFWQTPGTIAPYVVSMVLLKIVDPAVPAEWVLELQFRILFALGAVPAGVVFLASLREKESQEFDDSRNQVQATLWASVRQQSSEVNLTLLGTAGSWLAFDVAYFGTSTFQPEILRKICLTGIKTAGNKCDQTLFEVSFQSVITSCMGFPGVILAIALLDSWGSKRLNSIGFLLLALTFGGMGVIYGVSPEQDMLLFIVFCCLTLLLNFGPNVGTFVLPAMCFPTEVRSTYHGLSAAGGKLGAALGALIFKPLVDSPLGLPGVLSFQALLCLVGGSVSHFYLKHDWEYTRESSCVDG